MLVVISPAKKMNEDIATPENGTTPRFQNKATAMARHHAKLPTAAFSKAMHISQPLAELTKQRFEAFDKAPPQHAIQLYAGDTYTGLEAQTWNDVTLEKAQKRLRILSGLYGLLKPRDLIKPHRLEMGCGLAHNGSKNLYQHWQEDVTNALNDDLNDIKSTWLLNTASQEYFKAVKTHSLNGNIITPVFLDWKNGQWKTISFHAKKARGAMARFCVESDITTPEELSQFQGMGYTHSASDSTQDTPVFTRKQP